MRVCRLGGGVHLTRRAQPDGPHLSSRKMILVTYKYVAHPLVRPRLSPHGADGVGSRPYDFAVSRTTRDNVVATIVGLVAALVASLIAAFTPNLTHLADVGVFGAALAGCALALAGIYGPGMARRRRERWRKALKAEIMAESRAEIEPMIAMALETRPATVQPGEAESLTDLLIKGRDLQAQCRGVESSYVIPDGRAVAALLTDPGLLIDFRHEPWAGDVFQLSAREAHKMLDSKLGTLETAIRKNVLRVRAAPERVTG